MSGIAVDDFYWKLMSFIETPVSAKSRAMMEKSWDKTLHPAFPATYGEAIAMTAQLLNKQLPKLNEQIDDFPGVRSNIQTRDMIVSFGKFAQSIHDMDIVPELFGEGPRREAARALIAKFNQSHNDEAGQQTLKNQFMALLDEESPSKASERYNSLDPRADKKALFESLAQFARNAVDFSALGQGAYLLEKIPLQLTQQKNLFAPLNEAFKEYGSQRLGRLAVAQELPFPEEINAGEKARRAAISPLLEDPAPPSKNPLPTSRKVIEPRKTPAGKNDNQLFAMAEDTTGITYNVEVRLAIPIQTDDMALRASIKKAVLKHVRSKDDMKGALKLYVSLEREVKGDLFVRFTVPSSQAEIVEALGYQGKLQQKDDSGKGDPRKRT